MVHARSRSRAVTAFVMIVMCIGASFAACADLKRSNGEECIKNEECASLVCASMKCVAQPPLLNGVPSGGDGTDAATPGVDSGKDSAGVKDSAPSADTGDDGPGPDALNDAVSDALDDAIALEDGALEDGALQDGPLEDGAFGDANDATASDGASGESDALSDASDSAHQDADAFDATLDVNLDVNVPDVLGG